jgi:hypothetical protein
MKRYMPLIILGFLLFVGVGDQVLPGTLGTASTQTRTAMNDFLGDREHNPMSAPRDNYGKFKRANNCPQMHTDEHRFYGLAEVKLLSFATLRETNSYFKSAVPR